MNKIFEAYKQSILNEVNKKLTLKDFITSFEKVKSKVLAKVKRDGQDDGAWFEIAQDFIFDVLPKSDDEEHEDIIDMLSDRDFDKLQDHIMNYLTDHGIELD